MTIPTDPETTTLVIPLGTTKVAVQVPTLDRTLWARYLIASLAALRAGRHGRLEILHPGAYAGRIVEQRAERLAAGGPERAALVAEMEGKIAVWLGAQSSLGPPLGVICAAMFRGELVDADGRRLRDIDTEPEAAELLVALLGHDPDDQHSACPVCDAVAHRNWAMALAASGTPPGVVIDAYRLAVDAGWLPPLPDVSVRKPPIPASDAGRRPGLVTIEPPGGYDEDDL
jgi:hypothetical protein